MGRKLSFLACASCGRGRTPRDKGAFGYCKTCYARWDRHGRPPEGPPPAYSKAAQLEDLQWLLKTTRVDRSHGAHGVQQLAGRLGVNPKTVYRYLQELKRAG